MENKQIKQTKYQITNGYVGDFGLTWKPLSENDVDEKIQLAANFNGTAVAEIVRILEAGQPVKWQESPNYYYDHSYGMIRPIPAPAKQVEMRKCSCGHTIPVGLVMSASLGSSCPDCYDRMSD